MQFREIMAVCSKNHMEHISGKNTKFFKVRGGGTYSNHCFQGLNTKVDIDKINGD
jgi:hypothetical protein